MKYQDYQTTPGVRELVDALKQTEDPFLKKRATAAITNWFLRFGQVDRSSYLVPVPQHSGDAEYTKDICEALSSMTGAKVLDIVKCSPVPCINKYKPKIESEYEFYRTNTVPKVKNSRFYFVDTIINTGETYRQVNDLFDQELVPMVFAVDYKKLKDQNILTAGKKPEKFKRFFIPKKG